MKLADIDKCDWSIMTGLGCVFAGLWMVSLPLAFVVAGAVLLYIGLFWAQPPKPTK